MAGQRAARWNWGRIALAASLLLNLFLVALIGGHFLRAGRAVGPAEPLARALAHAEAVLPPRDAAAFDAVIRRDAPRYAAAAMRLDAARRAVARQVIAERFDPAGAKAALTAWEGAWVGFFNDFSSTLVEALAQVSPEGRRKLVAERRAARGDLSPP